MYADAIPVLYYHSVADHNTTRAWSFLTCDIETFVKQMRYLAKRGYYACNWDELYEHMHGIKQLPKKSIMIQFDDGFLDNWSVVFKIMKELNFKFSVVVTPEFIQRHPVRPFVDATTEENLSEWWGYLCEEELLEMESSGLVDIQAHGYTHTWYPVSDEIIDVYDGTQIEPWLFWNDNIEQKAKWLTNDSLEQIPLGYPIFKNEKSLANLRAFKPSVEFIRSCIDSYNPSKSANENLEVQKQIAADYRADNKLGSYESEDESLERLKKELLGTRNYLERVLGKRVEYLVWPGGGNNERVEQLAFESGYKLISKGSELNKFNCRRHKISRVAAYHEFTPKIIRSDLNVMFLQLQIWRASGNKSISFIVDSIKKLRRAIR